MKKALCLLGLCLALGGSAPVADAHDLLPKALVEYVQTHPTATPAEIEAFMNGTPALASKDTASKMRLIEAAKHPQQTGFFGNALAFIRLGIGHILSGPDHILFVLSLLLVFHSLRHTLTLISCFTLSHSITLLLAGSNLLVLSARIVEPMIAFSIAFMAISTVFFREQRYKSLIVFGFGLFHGLGFAGLLRDLAIPQESFVSSLLFFNVGIEVGQMIILCCALPLLFLCRHKRWYPQMIRVFAIAISAIALVWMMERFWL